MFMFVAGGTRDRETTGFRRLTRTPFPASPSTSQCSPAGIPPVLFFRQERVRSYSTTFSISPAQNLGPSFPWAKAAIISNTSSEKPPTLRMSERSIACTVP